MASDKDLRPSLEKAGERYFNILQKGSEQVNYDGHSLGKTKRYVSEIHGNQCNVSYSLLLQYKGRVVLDPTSFWSYSETDKTPPRIGAMRDDESGVEGCNCVPCLQIRTMPKLPRWSTYDDIDPKNEKQELTPDHFMLFPRKILGFVLKTREWGT